MGYVTGGRILLESAMIESHGILALSYRLYLELFERPRKTCPDAAISTGASFLSAIYSFEVYKALCRARNSDSWGVALQMRELRGLKAF